MFLKQPESGYQISLLEIDRDFQGRMMSTSGRFESRIFRVYIVDSTRVKLRVEFRRSVEDRNIFEMIFKFLKNPF